MGYRQRFGALKIKVGEDTCMHARRAFCPDISMRHDVLAAVRFHTATTTATYDAAREQHIYFEDVFSVIGLSVSIGPDCTRAGVRVESLFLCCYACQVLLNAIALSVCVEQLARSRLARPAPSVRVAFDDTSTFFL